MYTGWFQQPAYLQSINEWLSHTNNFCLDLFCQKNLVEESLTPHTHTQIDKEVVAFFFLVLYAMEDTGRGSSFAPLYAFSTNQE